MYLRTPKRYQVGHRKRHLFSLKWLWLWILTPLVIGAGLLIYEERDTLGPPVRQAISDVIDSAGGGLATMVAPTALPTQDPSDRILRGDNAWQQGAIEQAVTEYRAAAGGAPNNFQVHYRLAYGLVLEGEYEDALSAAENAVTANPFVSDGWAVRGLALSGNGRYPEAVASAMQALSLDSKNATALAFLSEIYLAANQTAQAEERANQAISADPENAEGYYARGLWNTLSNFDYVSAVADFAQANELAPNLPHILVRMAEANFGIASFEGVLPDLAVDQLEQVVESNPNNIDALYNLGYIQYQAYGDAEKSRDYLERCIQVDPTNISCLNYMGTILSFSDPATAVGYYQRVVDTGRAQAIHYLRAGRTYVTLNDCRSAVPLLRTGYNLEQQATSPNTERLAAFQEFLSQCSAPFVPPSAQATNSGPLLIPLGDATATPAP